MKVICFDLDDTLSKEIDYLKSAYREIAQFATTSSCYKNSSHRSFVKQEAYKTMLDAYDKGKNAFEELNVFLGVQNPINVYLNIYRNHQPNIFLSEETRKMLFSLRNKGYKLGLITDGRSVQQRSKINALELSRWIDDEDIIISEEFGSEKPSEKNYIYFMDKFHNAEFTYVGDNPQKDFIGPNTLGWNTVCLLDDGKNIHKQDFEKYSTKYQPQHIITSISELLNII